MSTRLPSSEKLDATFAALSDPTRRAIVARLASGEATVLELALPFDISLPASDSSGAVKLDVGPFHDVSSDASMVHLFTEAHPGERMR